MSRVITGDAFEVLADMDANSVHAVVTDPPYGLAFMGRDWDDFEPKEYQEWCEEWAREAKRVLKPGGHLLAFSGNRTHHRLFSGVEDAGFEIRDTITWHYGSGFPKALDVSKAIDKRGDAEREVVARREADDVTSGDYGQGDSIDDDKRGERTTYEYTEPATDAAERWDGFKTALKPATEFVVLARAPLSEGTVAENVQTHGTGALNIDGCRVGDELREFRTTSQRGGHVGGDNSRKQQQQQHGRYPANVVFDEQAAADLDREVGELDAGARTPQVNGGNHTCYGDLRYTDAPDERIETDSGGPSRYFYTSKATRAERTLDGRIDNTHPTVKPQDLMEWLVKLTTREGHTVLDPFAGSGTTGRAAKALGRAFILIEQNPKWAGVARARCGLTPEDPGRFTDDDQPTLQQSTDTHD